MLLTSLTTIAFLAVAGFCTCEAAELYDVACPSENSELSCSEGQVIEVLKMEYGPAASVDCSVKDKPVTVASSLCLHPMMLPWTKSICDNLEYCRLPKPNGLMFMCDDSRENFIQYTYVCIDRQPGELTVQACDGNEAKLSCESGLISVVMANFGRLDEDTCTNETSVMTFCSSQRAELTVVEMCEGKEECTVPVNEDELGEPTHCDNLPTYLHVDYVCV